MAELLPCPFCGGVGTLHSIDMCETVYAVCMNCGVRTTDYKHAEQAINKWNTRTPKEMHEKHTETHDNTQKERGGEN